MALHSLRAADDNHCAVNHLQGPLHFRGEIHMSRRIQQPIFPPLPGESGLPGKDGNPPAPFQRMGVHKAVSIIHPSRRADGMGLQQKLLAKRCLACVHMRGNANHHNSSSLPT